MPHRSDILVIADLTGFSRFMRHHRERLDAAAPLMARLLRPLSNAGPPLELVDVEGDAAFYRAPCPLDPDERKACMTAVADEIRELFRAFDHARHAIDDCIDDCANLYRLELKVIVHAGPVALQEIAGASRPMGYDVVLAHRILKNQVDHDRYVMVTRDLVHEAGLHDEAPWEPHRVVTSEGDAVETLVLPVPFSATVAAAATD